MESKTEEKIFNDLLVWIKENHDLNKEKLETEIIKRIKEQNYLKEDWQEEYGKERIKDEIIKIIKSKQDTAKYGIDNRQDLTKFLGWKRYFTLKNLIINTLISFIPFALVLGMLRELGFGGALFIILLWALFIWTAGIIREKIGWAIHNKLK